MIYPIITKREADKILAASRSLTSGLSAKVKLSLDLNMTITEIETSKDSFNVAGIELGIADLNKIDEGACYVLFEGKLQKLALFSEETNFYYKLVPTNDWPTITLSSTPMHRHTKITPRHDTKSKIKEISPVKGRVLDTCCGLGYTAVMSAKFANEVYTFEHDKNMLYMAGFNPHSQDLFSNKKIKVVQKDVFEGIKEFKNNFFDRIIHDPPTFKYSPMLYSSEFYNELLRVLRPSGILYHYAPAPQKTHDRQFYTSIIKRLKEAGFRNVEYHEASSGIRAVK
jgi:predicted methyltransferase